MCGIIGYLGDHEATPVLMDSLKRLEYRGYDSTGVAVLELPNAGSTTHTSVTKSEKKVDDLIAKLKTGMPTGHLGIGHTRWATHGRPTYLNAPTVVGRGEDEYSIASDITAIIPYTKRVLVLGEGEVAAVTPLGAEVSTLDGITVKPKLVHVDWDVSQAQKGGYPHFMLKEIHEASEAVANAMRGRLTDDGQVMFREFATTDEELRRYREVVLLGMGTSRHASLIGEYAIEDWSGLPARAIDAAEFRYRRPTFGPDTLAVVVTQSGETAAPVVGVPLAKARGAPT